jgi:hypothetical protein
MGNGGNQAGEVFLAVYLADQINRDGRVNSYIAQGMTLQQAQAQYLIDFPPRPPVIGPRVWNLVGPVAWGPSTAFAALTVDTDRVGHPQAGLRAVCDAWPRRLLRRDPRLLRMAPWQASQARPVARCPGRARSFDARPFATTQSRSAAGHLDVRSASTRPGPSWSYATACGTGACCRGRTPNGYGVWHGMVEYYVGERHWQQMVPESRLRPS